MLAHLRASFVLLALFTGVLGFAYPLAITGVAQLAFPDAANGSPVMRDGALIGSALIGQAFAQPRYFQPRPSATSAADPADATKTIDAPYNAANSSGSNFGPLSQKLIDRVKAGIAARNASGPVPGDAVTTSGSGLDPHISPENALSQAASVAAARGMSVEQVKELVAGHVEGRIAGVIGEPRVNVLLLNLALDRVTSQ